MPKGLKVSRPLIANMIPFVNISNFFKWNKYLHYDMWMLIINAPSIRLKIG